MTKPYLSTSVPSSYLAQTLGTLRRHGETTSIKVSVSGMATHPEDDLVLAAVATAQADFPGAGDADVLALGRFGRTRIVRPVALIGILDMAMQPPTGE